MFKFGKRVLTVLMVMVLLGFSSLSNANSSYAKESELDQKVLQGIEKAKEATEDLEKVEEKQAKVYIKKLEKLINNGSINLHTNENINFEDVLVLKNTENKEVVVQIPLLFAEDTYELATVYFSKGKELKSYMENHYSADLNSYEVKVETWVDNQIVLDNLVQLEAKYFEQEEKEKEETLISSLNPFGTKTASANAFTDFLKGFNNCLAAQGIAAWAITAASIACAGLGPAGASACYYGLSFLTGGVVGYCWTSAKYYL
jgi:hypothetical protein